MARVVSVGVGVEGEVRGVSNKPNWQRREKTWPTLCMNRITLFAGCPASATRRSIATARTKKTTPIKERINNSLSLPPPTFPRRMARNNAVVIIAYYCRAAFFSVSTGYCYVGGLIG